jgi:hypothetical protein
LRFAQLKQILSKPGRNQRASTSTLTSSEGLVPQPISREVAQVQLPAIEDAGQEQEYSDGQSAKSFQHRASAVAGTLAK